MRKAQEGDTVKVHYTGTLEGGEVFDSSREREPIEFTIGSKGLIAGFASAVVGMAVGDTTSVDIPPEEAYGEPRDELVIKVGRAEFPEDITPEAGLGITIKHPKAGAVDTVITEVHDEFVIMDANPPLAGKTLNFEIEMIEISG